MKRVSGEDESLRTEPEINEKNIPRIKEQLPLFCAGIMTGIKMYKNIVVQPFRVLNGTNKQ